ncbi:MAG: translational GTPase TypA [Deltaproteobacteria bacterium]|nr:translational GTPase TypA [Deltaproteobacteria bacterium]
MDIRNIAIIAHVDHGKTTMVDRILHQVKLFRDNQTVQDLILDSNDLERERGITILSKNVSVRYKGTKINIIDTPGHSDFGGEVERVMNMADGVLLIVDAFEGPMPQTRFVLQKALSLNLKPIVVINKVDKLNCNPEQTNEMIFELMYSLDATDEQLDFPTVYGSSKEGWMGPDWKNPTKDVSYLLDTIINYIQPPKDNPGTLQLQISSLDYSSYTGRIAVGRIHRGSVKAEDQVSIVQKNGEINKAIIKELYLFEGLGKEKTKKEVKSGEIAAIMGLEQFDIGDTIADFENPEALPPIAVDEPTMSMFFTVNDSPFFGKEGKYITSKHVKARLFKETEKNLALKVEETDSAAKLKVYGRGTLHLSILVETMRREGYELQLSQPRVVTKKINGFKHEPVEILNINVPQEFSGKIIELVTARKADILNIDKKKDRINLEFKAPARSLIGLTQPALTVTEGEAMISHRFKGYEPWKGEIKAKRSGALIAMQTGTSVAYAIHKLQDRGIFFIEPNEEVYAGQVIGENTRTEDLVLNVLKTKKLTNMRASGSDEKLAIAPPIKFSLEEAMEYIREDEYVEATPKSIRIRKIELDANIKKKNKK